VSHPGGLPWARPRRELLLLALVAAAALSIVSPPSVQDSSRFCLTHGIEAGRLTVDNCIGETIDRSFYGGHFYTNKAPGMSLLALPAAEAVRLPTWPHWTASGDLRLWAVRLFAAGLPFLLCVFLVGRISEGIAPGFGGAVLVTFGLGTLMAPLAVAGFDHVPTAAFGFAAFALAWSRRPLLAGLAAGAALLMEYEAAIVVLVLAAYVAFHGWRALLRFGIGALPGAMLVGAYDWIAFGAPWHNPLDYSDNFFLPYERSSFLGLNAPTWHAARLVFLGDVGLLVVSPVLLAAAAGLFLLWREGFRAESLVCIAITAAFLVAESSYFTPYGGISPGPRFLVPALPFLALGLAPAFASERVSVSIFAGISIVATIAVSLTWGRTIDSIYAYRNTVWGELGRLVTQGTRSRFANELESNIVLWAGPGRVFAAILVSACAAAAFVVALRSMPPERARDTPQL
jgi:hypothetical protein